MKETLQSCQFCLSYCPKYAYFNIFIFLKDLVAYQENCKKAWLLAERNSQIITKFLASSKVLNHFSFSVLQKKMVEIQAAFQVIFFNCSNVTKFLTLFPNMKKTCETKPI